MTLPVQIFFSFFILLASASSAIADDACRPFESPRLEPQFENCKKLERQNLINDDALEYTIKYLVANLNGLQDSSCATRDDAVLSGGRYLDRCQNCQSKEWITKGIENNCSFVINDMKKRWDKETTRTTAYFVNLCDSSGPTVKKFAMNSSKGKPGDDTPRDPQIGDPPSSNSVLHGAFVLNDRVTYDFYTESPAYNELRKDFKTQGGIPAIRMVGLNSSNNNTEFDKPFHVSAFTRGNGCPGVEKSTYPIMKEIVASKKSSLYMAYNGEKSEQKFRKDGRTSCMNDNSDATNAHYYAAASAAAASQKPRTGSRSINSVSSIQHRAVFDLPNSSKSVRKLQVDLNEQGNLLVARTKILSSTGVSTRVGLVCHKLSDGEFNCRRDDNGGGFNISFEPSPRLSIGYFSADDEAAAENLIVKGTRDKFLIVEGKKAAISKKDAF